MSREKFLGFVCLRLGFLLAVAGLLFACQLPGLLSERLSQATPTAVGMLPEYPGPTQSAAPSSVSSPGYPTPTSPAVTPLGPYPQPSEAAPRETATGPAYPPVDTSQPGFPYPQPSASTTASASQLPGPTVSATLVKLASPTPTSTGVSRAVGSVTPSPTTSLTLVQTASLTPSPTLPGGGYPGPGTPFPTPTSGPGGYPGPGTEAPTSTVGPGGYPGPGDGQPSPSPPFAEAPLTPTSSPVFVPSPVFPTATPVFAIPVTPTPVRYLTPTPTRTFTPTVTPTRRPPSPWVSSQLRATDPRTVKLASGKVQLVMFFAFWSGPSQAMAPVVHNLQAEYGSRMNFIYLDIDDPATETLQRQLGYRFEPHFFLLDPQGKIIQQWVGYVKHDDFVRAFESALP